MGPLEASLPWSMGGLDGARRFIDRVYRIVDDENIKIKLTDKNDGKLDYIYNFTVNKVTNDYDSFQFNTAISQMMILVNEMYKNDTIYLPYYEGLIKMLACICPHIGEEIWERLNHKDIIDFETWPNFDESKLSLTEIEFAIQINGKLRATMKIKNDASEEEIKEKALSLDSVKSRIFDKEIKKIIVIKNKIVNIVAI